MSSDILRQSIPVSERAQNGLSELVPTLLHQYSVNEQAGIVDAFVALDIQTKGRISAREFQIECAVALKMGRDVMCTAGCGSGKTLAMALAIMLLERRKLAITVVPLKLLQKNHVSVIIYYFLITSDP